MKKNLIVFVIALFLLALASYGIYTYSNYQHKINEEIEWQKKIFNISEFAYYSSASATQNDTGEDVKWDLNPYQYTNIAFKINNQNDYEGKKNKNTIKSLTIQNFKIITPPNVGNLNFYYKDPTDLSSNKLVQENLIQDKLEYQVLDFNTTLDYTTPQISRGSGYVSLQIANENIQNNFTISDFNTPIIYDGTLLQMANIPLDDLKYKISFDIILINDLDEEYKCTVELDSPITSEISDDNIYTLGSVSSYNNNPDIYTFYRTK